VAYIADEPLRLVAAETHSLSEKARELTLVTDYCGDHFRKPHSLLNHQVHSSIRAANVITGNTHRLYQTVRRARAITVHEICGDTHCLYQTVRRARAITVHAICGDTHSLYQTVRHARASAVHAICGDTHRLYQTVRHARAIAVHAICGDTHSLY